MRHPAYSPRPLEDALFLVWAVLCIAGHVARHPVETINHLRALPEAWDEDLGPERDSEGR